MEEDKKKREMKNNEKERTDVDTLLPFGDGLRTLIASSSHLTDSNLKNLLSQKGIYKSVRTIENSSIDSNVFIKSDRI